MASHQDTDVLATECECAILALYGSWANVDAKTKAAYDLLCREQPTRPSDEHRICVNQFGFDWDNARSTFVRLVPRASAQPPASAQPRASTQPRASAKRRAPSDLASKKPTKRPTPADQAHAASTPPGSVRNNQCTLQDLQDEAARRLGDLRAEERLAKVTEERDDALKDLEELHKDVIWAAKEIERLPPTVCLDPRLKQLEEQNADLCAERDVTQGELEKLSRKHDTLLADNSRVKELEQENAKLGKFLLFSNRLANVYYFGAQAYWVFLRTAIQENGLTHVKPPPPIPRTGDQKADASRFFFDVKDYAKDLGCEVTRKERTYEVVRASSSDKS